MNSKCKLVLPIAAALLLLSLSVPAVALGQTSTASRDIAEQTLAPGDTTQVTVTIDVAEAEALALDENPPAGWTLAQVSEDPQASIYNANTNEWVWFQAAVGTITVVYDLTAPPDAAGSYTIDGAISGEDWSEAVGSETGITVGEAPPPRTFTDSVAPTMSNISASAITETSADISWRTNEASTSQVEYWTSPGMLSPLDKTMTYSHLVHLTELTSGTTYHYKTMSRDAAGNVAVSDEDTFTTLGEAPAVVFTSSDLSISPSEVNIGEEVTISVLVTNTGSASGSYKVTLKIDGAVEATKEVTLNAGASKEVTFTTAKDVALSTGSYSVTVNGLSGSFSIREGPAPPPPPPEEVPPEVVPPPVKAINWPVVGGIIAAVVVIGLLIFFLARRRAV